MPPPSSAPNIEPPSDLTAIAAEGFLNGALRFGAITFASHILLTRVVPNAIYKGLTLQFKTFIQLSSMTLGGCIFAERRVTDYNDMVRRRNRALSRSARAWGEEQEIRARVDAERQAMLNSKS